MSPTRRALILSAPALAAAPAVGRPAAPAIGRPAAPAIGRPAAPAIGRPAAPAIGRPAAPLIVLDPGHGGKDPGAIGVAGAYEKHVAFAAAQQLQRQLAAAGHRVALTRDRDEFIPLAARVDRAQRQGAALFVSIHADALADHSVRGASVYTLSDAASDSQTAALARRENSADRFAGPQFQQYDATVANILASLVRQETRAGSAQMARQVVQAFGAELPLLANPARHAQFVVLKAADIPSVLVEMGFMSNALDEAALRQADHRASIAAALRRAIEGFFATTERPARRFG